MAKLAPKISIESKFLRSWNGFKSKLLLKYTLSYILIFLIPLTLVTLLIYENAVNALRKEIEQTNFNQLNQAKITIDERMSELQHIASRIAYDQKLSAYMVHDPYYSMEAIETLGNYKANSGILEDLFLYFHNDNQIYSYRGLTDIDIVFGDLYHYDNWDSKQIYHDLNEINQPTVRPAEYVTVNLRKDSTLTMLFPIKPTDLYPNATVVYMVNEAMFTGVMDTILNSFSGNGYIFTQDGQLLTSVNKETEISPDTVQMLSTLEPGIHNMKLNGIQHSVVSTKSKENNWTYVTTIPSYQFFSKVVHIQTLILIVFLVTVISGVAAAVFLAKRQYHPIKDIIEFTKQKYHSNHSTRTRNEWEWIKQTIHEYSARIDTQVPFVRNQCLLLLFKHGKPNDPDIESMIIRSGLEYPGEQGIYLSMILAWDDCTVADEALSIQHYMQETLSELELPNLQTRIFGIEFNTKDQFALLVSMPADHSESVQKRIEAVIEAIKILVTEKAQVIPYFGVGLPYPDLASMNQSFIEAATAIDNRIIGENGRVTYFEQLQDIVVTEAEAFWIPKKSFLKLEQSLKQGNESVANQVIGDILRQIKEEALSPVLLRCICSDLLNSLLRTSHELGVTEVFKNLNHYTVYDTLEELEAGLTDLTRRICDQVERNTEMDQPSLIEDIVSYVDQRYADYTLSLEHVALKYSVSISYLSRTFKDKTGINFTQYIWQRRMEEVKRLLITTNAPLKEIIEQVGYLDAANFIRKFKKETGVTPGQFRKQHEDQGKTSRSLPIS